MVNPWRCRESGLPGEGTEALCPFLIPGLCIFLLAVPALYSFKINCSSSTKNLLCLVVMKQRDTGEKLLIIYQSSNGILTAMMYSIGDLIIHLLNLIIGFLGSSADKESVCNAGDPSSIPGLEVSPEEGIGYPFHCSWASLVVQTIKNLPATRETWI